MELFWHLKEVALTRQTGEPAIKDELRDRLALSIDFRLFAHDGPLAVTVTELLRAWPFNANLFDFLSLN